MTLAVSLRAMHHVVVMSLAGLVPPHGCVCFMGHWSGSGPRSGLDLRGQVAGEVCQCHMQSPL